MQYTGITDLYGVTSYILVNTYRGIGVVCLGAAALL
jgi:hypothetical protein